MLKCCWLPPVAMEQCLLHVWISVLWSTKTVSSLLSCALQFEVYFQKRQGNCVNISLSSLKVTVAQCNRFGMQSFITLEPHTISWPSSGLQGCRQAPRGEVGRVGQAAQGQKGSRKITAVGQADRSKSKRCYLCARWCSEKATQSIGYWIGMNRVYWKGIANYCSIETKQINIFRGANYWSEMFFFYWFVWRNFLISLLFFGKNYWFFWGRFFHQKFIKTIYEYAKILAQI
jgi:hypothetical protein